MLRPVKNLDEFVKKYDKDLERILCKSFKKYIDIDELPVVKNDVYLHLLEKKFFEKYDPKKAQLSTYLYTYLFKFLKSRKNREDRELVNNSDSLNEAVFEEGGATLLDVRDFNYKSFSPAEAAQLQDWDKEIQKLMEVKIKNVVVLNPFDDKTLESLFWSYLQVPRTLKEIEKFVQENMNLFRKNPYDAKKDDVKYSLYGFFAKNKFADLVTDKELWLNVAGVSKLNPNNLDAVTKKVYNYILNKSPSVKELGSLRMDSKKKSKALKHLQNYGYVIKKKDFTKAYNPQVFVKNPNPVLHFNKTKNLSWHLIDLMKEAYSELMVFENNTFSINAKENAAYKIYQMIVNGKSNKHISNTYKIKNSLLSATKKYVLNDIKKMVLE